MALKGLDIFKLTPKKNCKECGSPTCMAFAMKVAQGAVSIDKCPYMSADALATLSEATASTTERSGSIVSSISAVIISNSNPTMESSSLRRGDWEARINIGTPFLMLNDEC